MAKNILIFSDGTGQGGGVTVDENRSNVYKLFRATRCGPDSTIDPTKQVAFYDPGLGSESEANGIQLKSQAWFVKLIGKATGFGITTNIIDCYTAIIRLWEPGDRIYLFGFSRGAYTVRCLAGALAYCGIPTQVNGKPLPKDPRTIRRVASEAVKRVYQHGSSIPDKDSKGRKIERNETLIASKKAEREALAAEFRTRYASGNPHVGIADDDQKANCVPYFIGVWDTVSALGTKWIYLVAFLSVAFSAGILKYAPVLIGMLPGMPDFGPMDWRTSIGIIALCIALLFLNTWITKGTLDLRKYRMAFYDDILNKHVAYARHALSIDENRADFVQQAWKAQSYENTQPEHMIQLWFAGVHSDIGGSYPENEARLSDIALEWMVQQAKNVPDGIIVDTSALNLYPSAEGMQHDEIKDSRSTRPWYLFWFNWGFKHRTIAPNAPLHPSVVERFKVHAVLDYDEMKPYRPKSLAGHLEVSTFYP